MMLFDDTYKTIAGPSESVFRDRGSNLYFLRIYGFMSYMARIFKQ